MNIVQFEKTDTEEIVALFYNTVHTICVDDYSNEQLNAWAPLSEVESKIENWSTSLSENITYVAKKDASIVGFADLTYDGLLDRLYVHKDFQCLGIASTLLAKLESAAIQLKMLEIKTYASITAKPFFENHDYTCIHRNTVERNGTILTNFYMKKTL
ncbi:GNAT family N-acetyltransferase [Psychrobacillus sp.]|uniref:GNAT family N-acetyltransferase n=1 Tax=Psychrobacillus sp. TaxID=1871623 RepID=UPI0028BECC1F|nr:GNAT family N-acetyltransferase [Psychrobacillus sp.]